MFYNISSLKELEAMVGSMQLQYLTLVCYCMCIYTVYTVYTCIQQITTVYTNVSILWNLLTEKHEPPQMAAHRAIVAD